MKNTLVINILILTLAFVSSPVHASGLFIEGYLGVAKYSLGDLNDEIDAINELAGSDYLDNVTSGIDIGGKLGFTLASGILVGAEVSALSGSTEYSDSSGALDYKVPALLAGGFVSFPLSKGTGPQLALGANLGLVRSAGSVSISIPGELSASGDLEGTGLSLAASFDGSIPIGSSLKIVGQLGYRYATIGEVKVDNVVLRDLSGSKYELDYNGVFFRAGLRILVN